MKKITVKKPDQKIWLEAGEYEVILDAPHASVEIRGGARVPEKNQYEITVNIIHRAPHTQSHTLIRTAVEAHARAKILGTITVEKTAHDTQAFLTENVLLLAPSATAEAIPNLEIATDQVRCSHAATVAPVPAEHILYLQTRGITAQKAQNILVDSFLQSVEKD